MNNATPSYQARERDRNRAYRISQRKARRELDKSSQVKSDMAIGLICFACAMVFVSLFGGAQS